MASEEFGGAAIRGAFEIVGLTLVLTLASCSKAGSAIVVYTSVDDVFARPVAERFTRESGVRVELVPDTEETKSTGLVNRLIAERERPRADVFWSGDPMPSAVLKAKGVTEAFRSNVAEGLPPEFSDPDGYWIGFSARARVLVVNTALVPEGAEPSSVKDLLDARFRGRACLADPLFGTTSMHAAALFSVLGETEAKAFFDGFVANGGRVLSSNGEVRRRVANGEFSIGITDTDDANVARLEGKPVRTIYPDSEGMGTLLVPNCVSLIRGAPDREDGMRFIDWLLRPEVEKALSESEAAQIPLRPGVPAPNGFVPLGSLRPMRVDYGQLAAIFEGAARGYLHDWVARNG
jgi:iron(III) transport system substrate-binding protein